PQDVKDPQPDGYDKIFLPCDVTDFDKTVRAVPNAITGREIGAWLRPIPRNKASLWLIMDSCHSGSAVRGVREKVRRLDPAALKVPEALMKEAADRAAKRGEKKRAVDEVSIGPIGSMDGVVLTYACLAKQTTLEGPYKHPLTG